MHRLASAALASSLILLAADAEVVFHESFESPVVSGFDNNTVPAGGNWIGSSGAFNASLRGLYNESVVWPATPAFSTPYGNQGYSLNYSTTMLTTAQGATGQTITAGVTYSLTFHAAKVEGTTANHLAHLVAFDVADDNAARQNPNSMAGTIVAQASGAITASDMSDLVTITFTPDASHPHLGKELGIRFDKASGNAIYDNVRLIVGHDLNPNPASGEDLAAGGNVTLGWTNLPPNAPAIETPVDVWFGSEPGSLGQVVDGQITSSTIVSAPQAGTWYWRVDSYPDGDPDGTPVTGNLFLFTIADTDGDGIPDEWEIQYFGGPTAADANADPDTDGLTNLQEYIRSTHPNNPDTDGDGLLDGVETATGIWVSASDTGTLPLVADTDGDGLPDGVETNTGVWNGANDTGTNPLDPDTDGDGLLDSWETNTGVFLSRTNTGTNPHSKDTDGDGVWDYYEVAAAFTDPNDPDDSPSVPYPLPIPDPSDTGVTNKPVKVYIMSGQSNMLGFGKVSGPEDSTLDNITGRFNRFPNLVGPGGEYLTRPDVKYRGLISGTSNMSLAPGGGKDSNSIGPELGFGHVMGWYHDEPVLLIKPSIGNRSLGWDILPPNSPSYEYGGETFAGYGEGPSKRAVGEEPATDPGWWAGREFDRFFTDESEWVRPQDAVTNVVDVLDNFATQYPEWAGQGFEIAGFVWWQGDKDRYDMGYATQYEANLVNLIHTLRNYYSNRYPGKVAPSAPFVLATLGQTTMDATNAAEKAILDAKFAVDGDSGKYPEFAGNVKTVYANPLSQGGSSNGHYNLNSETYLLIGDALGRAMLDLQDDTSPPFPDPLTFAIAPTAVDATTVGMVATTASDPSGPVEYFFENLTNVNTSGWITETRWDNTGLAPGSYEYRVKSRDALGNESSWSATATASPGADVTAPTPDPMSFEALPAALGESSIAMAATTASDINGVEYFFECTVGGGPNSGWQASADFTALGLSPNTEYTYVVRARDSLGNVTGDSAPASATTPGPDVIDPTATSFSPLPGSGNIPVDTDLVVTFDEDIAIGSGHITIRNLTDGPGGDIMIDITDASQISVSGPVLTLTPTADLLEDTDYAVRIDATAITDLVGNTYAGIPDDSTWTFSTPTPPPVGLLLFEDFESPDVTAAQSADNTSGTLPDNGNWIGANQGFGSGRRGIVDESSGTFADPTGEQAFAFRYTNSGLTTAPGKIGTLTAGQTITVSFDVCVDGHNGGSAYRVALVTFADGTARNDCRGTWTNGGTGASAALATTSGNAAGGAYEKVSISYTADGTEATLGQDLALRFFGATSSANIDNVSVTSSGGTGGGNRFADWIAGYDLDGLDGFDDDFDNDGIPNGLENYFGTDPGVFSGGPVPGTLDGNTFTFSHPLGDSPADDVSAAYLWSVDLATYHADGATADGTTVNFAQGAPVNGIVEVTATFTGTLPARLFVVIEATRQ